MMNYVILKECSVIIYICVVSPQYVAVRKPCLVKMQHVITIVCAITTHRKCARCIFSMNHQLNCNQSVHANPLSMQYVAEIALTPRN